MNCQWKDVMQNYATGMLTDPTEVNQIFEALACSDPGEFDFHGYKLCKGHYNMEVACTPEAVN